MSTYTVTIHEIRDHLDRRPDIEFAYACKPVDARCPSFAAIEGLSTYLDNNLTDGAFEPIGSYCYDGIQYDHAEVGYHDNVRYLVLVKEDARPTLPPNLSVSTQTLLDLLKWAYHDLKHFPTLRDNADTRINQIHYMLTWSMGYSEREELFRQAREACDALDENGAIK